MPGTVNARTEPFVMPFTRFLQDRKAGVAPMLALAAVPLIGFVGAAVDYSRANAARTSMQAALDSTALMLSKDAQFLSLGQLQEKATAYFNALFMNKDAQNVQVTQQLTSPQQGSFNLKVTSSGTVPTVFARVLGHDFIDISATGEVVWGMKRLNLALALDNTGSMSSSGKIEALKAAAHNLLDTLKKAEKNPGDILVSIVPFAVGVNVGTNNAAAAWIDWAEWEGAPPSSSPSSSVGPGSSCPWSNGSQGFRCQSAPANGSSTVSNVPSSGAYNGYLCPTAQQSGGQNVYYYNGCYNSTPTTQSTPPYQHTWIANARSTWNGCVTDRDQNHDVNATATGGAANYRARQLLTCPTAMMPLSSDWDALHAKIDAMTPNGNTNVTIGMQMAWQTLSPVAPFNAPATAPDLDKVIILLTDGDNTQNRWTTSSTSIDARTQAACANAKAANIKVYSVRVINGNASLLQGCASKPDMYFNVQQASELNAVFSAIAQNLANLRIAK
jgi:Flp pilus assembly protein TadG